MLRRRPAPQLSRTRAALFGALAALLIFPLVIPVPGFSNELGVGDIAPRDLIARRDAQFESQALTKDRRDAAVASVRPVTDFDPTVVDTQLEAAAQLFAQIGAVRSRGDLDSAARAQLLGESPPASALSEGTRQALVRMNEERLGELQQQVNDALDAILSEPVTEQELNSRLTDYLNSAGATSSPTPSGEPSVLSEILRPLIRPTLVVNEQATAANRDAARENVSPEIVTVTAGQVVVPEGETLTEASIETLRHAGVIGDTVGELSDWLAGTGVALVAGIGIAVFLYLFQPVQGAVNRRLAIVGLAGFGALVAMRVVAPVVLPDDDRFLVFAIPVAVVAMLAASLLDLNFAVFVALVMGLVAPFIALTAPDVAGAQFGNPVLGFEMAAAYTASSLAAAASVFRAERFNRYGLASIATATSLWAVLMCFWLLEARFERESFLWLTGVAAANGIASSIITVGIFVLLSGALGVTTRLKLMELGQTDHPLLVRLQEEAPGTFQHSMIVGNLAERAARRIGADALTTRVGSYYHDIGKLAQPEYYVENQLDGSSPHDTLAPLESARRIMDHVTNGVALARKHRLPQLIIDFIPEHHGNRLVTFFYRRAREDEDADIDPEQYRYKGPRPQTKEAAIVMLADSCEALVRATGPDGREQIDELVDRIFAERLAEGQLDECDITMRDLQVVADSFKATFRAIYHPRVAYPAPRPEELAALARAEVSASQSSDHGGPA